MLSKETAFVLTRSAEEKEIEDLIKAASAQKEYQTEILNLTDYQQEWLKECGYSITNKATKQGYVWSINWQ